MRASAVLRNICSRKIIRLVQLIAARLAECWLVARGAGGAFWAFGHGVEWLHLGGGRTQARTGANYRLLAPCSTKHVHDSSRRLYCAQYALRSSLSFSPSTTAQASRNPHGIHCRPADLPLRAVFFGPMPATAALSVRGALL